MLCRWIVRAVVDTLDLAIDLFLFLVVFLVNPPQKPRRGSTGGREAF